MGETSRQQIMVERLLEDERLRGDLPDAAARELLSWATARVAAIAGDAARSDASVEAEVQALRRATLIAATSGEQEPARVLAQAEAQLSAIAAAPNGARTLSASEPALPSAEASEPQAALDRAVGGSAAHSRYSEPNGLPEPALRVRRSRLAPLLKRLREGR